MTARVLAWGLVLVLAQVADVQSTRALFAAPGFGARELGPVTLWVLDHAGARCWAVLLAAKLALSLAAVAGGLAACALARRGALDRRPALRRAAGWAVWQAPVLAVGMAAVAVWNAVQVFLP